jgi:phosphoglycolate phosphatase
MPTLLLFDIDGTLITTGGAGYRAIKRAVEVTMGVQRALDGIPVAGRTDSIILRDAIAAIDGRELTPELRDRIRSTYMGLLREEIDLVGGGPGVLPGVRALLDRLSDDPAYHVALLTGNFSQTAEIKLGYFDLWRHFAWGAFGEDAVNRNDLLPVALERYRQRTGHDIAPADVVIIGDTPNDVEVARMGQARSVCVTTGQFDRDALLEAGADVVFHDFGDVEEVLRVFAGGAGRPAVQGE